MGQMHNPRELKTPFVPKKETTYWPRAGGPIQPGPPTGSGGNDPTGTRTPCRFGWKCRAVLTTGKCENYHTKEDFKFLTDKFKAQKLAKKGMEKGKAKGDGKKTEGQQKKGEEGKGKGTAANDRKCYICQGNHLQKDCPKAPPTEKVAEIGELPPKKTNPRGRRGKLTAGDGDETFVLEEQFRNVKEQIQSHGSTTESVILWN